MAAGSFFWGMGLLRSAIPSMARLFWSGVSLLPGVGWRRFLPSELSRCSVLCWRHVRCFPAHEEHRTRSGIASLGQSLQMPTSLRS